ncbi:hypothetical protein Bca52824_063289 [Brassica carinata]|uniref:Uncharacterized protein n=1 Tax=Brassica carinata TaxID=52824 RepID=A0A8X7QJH9_BRACI|nr:hypothetical protein Bca52824_063289 [Brassica carinata]
MKDAAIDSGCLWPRNKSSLHARNDSTVFMAGLRCHIRRLYLNSADEFRTREIAVPVGAKIHGSGAAEETAVVRTETVWPSGV